MLTKELTGQERSYLVPMGKIFAFFGIGVDPAIDVFENGELVRCFEGIPILVECLLVRTRSPRAGVLAII